MILLKRTLFILIIHVVCITINKIVSSFPLKTKSHLNIYTSIVLTASSENERY